ncbi:hypothetical protein C8R44DRAFT_893278 [Mycena epipterygia]|nr:hypothetical protein C8R44DRAFT_893278 [Mycena epipterygia]
MAPFAASLLASFFAFPLLACGAPATALSDGLNATTSASLASASEVAPRSLTVDRVSSGVSLPPSSQEPGSTTASFTSSSAAHPLPTHLSGIPPDATHLALDEDAHVIIIFNHAGKELGRVKPENGTHMDARGVSRRDAPGPCGDLSSDDVQKLPGWATLKAAAEKNWGTGSYNVVTNDKDYPQQSAQNCVSQDTAPIAIDGSPSCQTQNSTVGGQLVGTSGSVTISHTEGSKYSTTTTVTEESSISVGLSVTATLGFPEIADVSSTFSIDTTITNTLSTSTTQENDLSSTTGMTVNSPEGKTCHLEFTTKSCTINGTGKVRMLGTGWVWFEYNDKTQGHYKWALSIDAVLTNQDDRSNYVSFKTATGSTDQTDYKGVCE